jgi:hypothetical protein
MLPSIKYYVEVARRGANANWASGRPILLRSARSTEFEIYARKLGLTPETYLGSPQLRQWCEQNRHRCYVPEWLLVEWGLRVDPTFSE